MSVELIVCEFVRRFFCPTVVTKLRLVFFFINVETWNFNNVFVFSLTWWDPIGVKISKRHFPYKSQPQAIKLFQKFHPNSLRKTILEIFEILGFQFLRFFSPKFQIHHHCSLWRNQTPQLSKKTNNRRANRSKIWGSLTVVQHIWDTFGLVAFTVILGSYGALTIFPKILFFFRMLLRLHLWFFYSQTLYNCCFWQFDFQGVFVWNFES